MGIVAPSLSREEITRTVRRMGSYLRHRGPDAWGEAIENGVGFGHTRLSILDIEHGSQPMLAEDGSVMLVFNGEIYNFKQLWRELEAKGRHFRTDHSDTEVILNGYLEWGCDVFSRLSGMFAVGIWDFRSQALLLGRDRMGIKPLYYADLPGHGVIFASEPKAIVASGSVTTSFDAEGLSDYFLYRAVAAPRTLWRELRKLPAAHIAQYSGQKSSSVSYWMPRASDVAERVQLRDASSIIEAELTEAVKSHMVADVPVGLFLSGGVDSSLVAALASKLASLDAFTIGTKSRLDEVPVATAVAAQFRLHLHTYYVDADEYLRALDDWVYYNDDPVADPSALALLLVSRYARQAGMKVMLSGEGSDELFCGYSSYVRYAAAHLARRVPLARQVVSLLGGLLDKRTCEYLEGSRDAAFIGTAHLSTENERKAFLINMREHNAACAQPAADGSISILRAALIFDQLIRLPNDILSRTDRATMATGIEARVPFLDNRVVDAANALHDSSCLQPYLLRTKPLLKSLLCKYLPYHLVYRRKQGFDLPIGVWLKTAFGNMVAECIGDRIIPGLNYEYWSKLYAIHCSGERGLAGLLWAWLVLERWYRQWSEGMSYCHSYWQTEQLPQVTSMTATVT